MWLDALERAGYRVRLSEAGQRLTVVNGEDEAAWHVRHHRRTPRPSEIDSSTDDLIWVPTMTAGLRARLGSLGASWVTDAGEMSIHSPWGLLVQNDDRAETTARPGSLLRMSPGALATLQYLLEHPAPVIQHRVAVAIGLSQPRIAQVLKDLGLANLVVRGRAGWVVVEPGRAFDVWLASNHGVQSATSAWYSLDRPSEQLAAISRQAQVDSASIRLCGDWAADLLGPLRLPGTIVIHSDATLDLENVGFVPAQREAATALIHIGPVRHEWSVAEDVAGAMTSIPRPIPLAPVTEIAREIMATGGTDAHQAVAELRRVWLRARTAIAKSSAA